MRAADFIARAELLREGGAVVAEGGLAAMLLRLERVAPDQRQNFAIRSERIGTLTAQHAAVLLNTYRGLLHSD
jgi:hypothetical protein